MYNTKVSLFFFFLFVEIICQDPGDINFGNKLVHRKNYDEDYITVGDRVEYTCFPNYKMEGFKLMACTNRGEWDNTKPKCKGKYFSLCMVP